MSNPQFTFPPPPPPPPQAPSNYNEYPQFPPAQRGPNDRGRGGGRGHNNRGRGHGRGGQRGGQRGGYPSGYAGYPPVNHRETNGQYGQTNGFGSSYPLPDYPPVQQPQYPASVHNAYSQSPPQYPPSVPYSISPPPYSGFPANGQHTVPNFSVQHHNHHYGRGSPNIQEPRHAPPRGPANQPIVMPPIRVGRDGRGGILRTQASQNPPAQFDHGAPVYNAYRDPSPNSFQQPRHEPPNPYQNGRGRGHQRGHSDVFHKPRNSRPPAQVAPAVPSFGHPLPGALLTRPPAPSMSIDATKKPKKKKKRRHNQLGLTPRTEEHESSEEEDDQDEESKLAATVGAASQQLEFTHHGQTMTLQSNSEILAWIAERKKRFPTKARAAEAAERKRQNQEAQRATRQAAKESQEKRQAEAKERQEKHKAEAREKQDKQKAEAKQTQEKLNINRASQQRNGDNDAKALKGRLKVEKLRKQLEKEEKRVAKAEAKASRANAEVKVSVDLSSGPTQSLLNRKRKRTDSLESYDSTNRKPDGTTIEAEPAKSMEINEIHAFQTSTMMPMGEEPTRLIDVADIPKTANNQDKDTIQNPLTPTSQPSIPDIDQTSPTLELTEAPSATHAATDNLPKDKSMEEADASDIDSNSSLSDSSSDVSLSDDDGDSTSSEGSSSSSDDAPETESSKREGPVRVPPPKRENPSRRDKNICRQFLKKGRCPRGEKCYFRHEPPEKGRHSRMERKAKPQEPKKERKGLYQRLVEQEQEQDDRKVLAAIVQLGERGMLAPPTDNGNPVE